MTSVNVTTQSNTVTVQQGDATTVTIATQGPQGPAGDGAVTINNNGTSKVITGSGTANTLNANTNLFFDGTTLDVKNGTGVIRAGQGTFNGTVDLSSAESNSSNTAQFKLSNLTIGQHQNVGSYRFANAGTGSFLFTADNINFFNKDVNKNLLRLSASGVELYHDNVKKAETSANGFDLPDNSKLGLGDSQDFEIYHNGTDSFIENSTGNVHIRSKTGEEAIKLIPDSAVQIYHDNAIAIHTQSWGNQLYGTLQALGDIEPFLDSADTTTAIRFKNNTGEALKIIHQSSNSFITNNVGSLFIEAKNGEKGIAIIPDAAVELYHNNVKKAQTSSTGFDIPEDFVAGSGSKLTVGASGDLTFFHDSANSYVQNNTGDLILGDTNHQYFRGNTSDKSVSLYFNGSEKVKTTNTGITVTGSVTTQDMNMSNLNGTANEVDNTKGSWSIQEGADDLFLINRVSGKKYKFNLTEVS